MPNTPVISRRAMLAGAGALALLAPLAKVRAEAPPPMTVTKDPSCGCCGDWIEHVRAAGFRVRVVESDDVFSLKQRLGVTNDLASCHTAEVDDYVVEGHVPASAIQRLLAERPAGVGLAVPGMPAGSPGMDYPGTTPEPYEVVLFGPAGRGTFARFIGLREV